VSVTFSHFGVCVSDLDRSTRFYEQALGFTRERDHEVGEEFGRLVEIDGLRLKSRFMTAKGARVELLWFEEPRADGGAGRRPMNRLGLTHMSVWVDDIDGVCERVRSLGGEVVTGTLTTIEHSDSRVRFVYCTDPDGVRIELMQLG
jgi:catechol 2,3-dioxygenase-like lactoylglutathione lyase family enzyme